MIFALLLLIAGAFIASQNTKSRVAWPMIVIGAVLLVRSVAGI